MDTFNACPPYHQIKAIHRSCRTICTYTCIHASKTWLGLCARCSRDGRWFGLVAITTATIIASASILAEAPAVTPTMTQVSPHSFLGSCRNLGLQPYQSLMASDITHLERIARALMHSLFVHYCAVLLADTPSIGVTRVVVCMAYSCLL